ncbi:MAG TPA: NADPH:quinone reductase [Gaiellales bacterium]|nr:NADPH:quinone reductase [Gaiellales bacterium]
MAETMRAAVYERYGPARDVLRVAEIDRPEPGPGEVRVRVRVSAVNPTDWRVRSGSQGGGDPPFPYLVPNQDGAGEIDAVGEGVTAGRVGTRVWVWFAAHGRQHGSAAQWVCLPERQAVPLPAGASFELGASLGIPALTAHHCLFRDGAIDGRTVLVAGGAGAVGHFAIELGRRGGARVIATVSSDEKAELARKAGAQTIVNYRSDDCAATIRAAAPEGVDRIVEVAPAANAALNAEVIAPNGVVAIYAADGDLATPVRPLMVRNAALRFVLVYNVAAEWLARAVDDVSAALAAGDLSELPAHRFELDDIAAAHEAVESGVVGKVLVDID